MPAVSRPLSTPVMYGNDRYPAALCCVSPSSNFLHHSVNHRVSSHDAHTLPDLLEESSLYVAAHFLKWHLDGAERREQTYHAG